MTTLRSGALGDRGIVGERRRLVAPSDAAARCACEQRGVAEDLRRLRPPQVGARHRFGDGARRHRRASACRRAARPGRRRRSPAPRGLPGRRRYRTGRTKGRAASWMATRSGGSAGQRFQAVQHRMLPAGAAQRPAAAGPSRRWPSGSAPSSPRRDHDLDPVDARAPTERPPECGAGPVARQKGILLGQGAAEAASPACQRRSGRYKLARGVR